MLDQSKIEEAEKLLLDTLDIARAATNDDETQFGDLLHNLASLYSDKQQYSEAQAYYEQALAASVQSLGKESIDTIKTMVSLAQVTSKAGKHERADELHRQAVAQAESTLGMRHHLTLTALNNFAGHLSRTNRRHEATTIYRDVWQGFVESLGEESERTLLALNNLIASEWEARLAQVLFQRAWSAIPGFTVWALYEVEATRG